MCAVPTPTFSIGARLESGARPTGCSSDGPQPSAAISDIRAGYTAAPRGLSRDAGRGAFARWREFRRPLAASGSLAVIYRTTQPDNAVQDPERYAAPATREYRKNSALICWPGESQRGPADAARRRLASRRDEGQPPPVQAWLQTRTRHRPREAERRPRPRHLEQHPQTGWTPKVRWLCGTRS